MTNKRYTKEHEWVRLENKLCFVGVSNYAQEQLGDIVFVELPSINKSLVVGDEVAVIESVKAATEIYAPISGKVIEVNEKLISNPDIINNDPENEGWIWKMEITDQDEITSLLDKESYLNFLNEV